MLVSFWVSLIVRLADSHVNASLMALNLAKATLPEKIP